MKRAMLVVTGVALLAAFSGCVSAERKAEYAAWKASDDGVHSISLDEFEAKYQQGWRERADKKKQVRLAREEAARVLARRQTEYKLWLSSDDKVDSVSLEVFEQKYKEGWRARAEQKKKIRLAREEKARQEAKRKAELAELQRKRDEVRDAIVAEDLAAIRKAYAKEEQYGRTSFNYDFQKLREETKGEINTWGLEQQLDELKASDWLREWVGPRLILSEADKLAGEALLSEFGAKFLPNAYANYEKVKDVAAELQQVFNEEFPEPWKIKNTSPKWNSFNKVLEKFAKVRTEYFMCHDELCYYWNYYRLGVVTADDLMKIDSQKLAVRLLPEDISREDWEVVKYQQLEPKAADFAAKYVPESYALYQRLEQEMKQTGALIDEVNKQRAMLDDVRYNRAFYNAQFKFNDLTRELNALVADFSAWHVDHRTTEKSAEDITKCDQARAQGLKAFAVSLSTYIKDRTLGSVIPKADMVSIPGRNYRMQRTEVTQMQWMLVMGNNPVLIKAPGAGRSDCPVWYVSWNDCKDFIKKLNGMEGAHYRLPTENEWNYAFLAGGKGRLARLRNGEEGPVDAMGWVGDSICYNIHGVALKEPNAWGLYDMYGNVDEFCEYSDSDMNEDIRYSTSHRAYCDIDRGGFVFNSARAVGCGFRLVGPNN